MTKLVVNAFSKDYVTSITTDHKDRTYKRPVLNQPPKNARVNLNGEKPKIPTSDTYRRIANTKI
jgi:hypothetical protein